MRIEDEVLDYLGEYFVNNGIHKTYEMTFMQFVTGYVRGLYDI